MMSKKFVELSIKKHFPVRKSLIAFLGLLIATSAIAFPFSSRRLDEVESRAVNRAFARAIDVTVTFSERPKDQQLYPRDLATNKAVVPISGSVTTAGQTTAILKIFRNNNLRNTLTKNLNYSGGSASFSFTPSINAELRNYRFELYIEPDAAAIPVATMTDVVAGDVYLINGQSNAVARMQSGVSGSANGNQNTFIRSFGQRVNSDISAESRTLSDTDWHLAEGDESTGPGAVGQWGLRLGFLLMDEYDVPIALINGGRGSKEIAYFQRNDAEPDDTSTNYGRLLWRADQAGATSAIRAIIWYQGESDGSNASGHQSGFTSLHSDWQQDYPNLSKIYVHQVRAGCDPLFPSPELRNVQRLFADTLAKVEIMSTTGIDGHDGCHYNYSGGYEIVGDHIFNLIGRDFYGSSNIQNIEPPNINSAYFTNETNTELTLEMRDPDDTLVWDSGAEADFVLEGSSITVTGGSTSGNKIFLTLSGSGLSATGITYRGHSGAGPWITNSNGIGLLAFHNQQFQLEPPDAPIVNTPIEVDNVVNGSEVSSVEVSGSGAASTSRVEVQFEDGITTPVSATVAANANGTWQPLPLDLSTLSDGAIIIKATEIDILDQRGDTAIQNIQKDTVAPSAPPLSSPTADGTIADNQPTFMGTAEANSSITLLDSEDGLLCSTVAVGGNWSCAPATPLADGLFTVRASATDGAGNQSTLTTHQFTVDTVAPSAPTVAVPNNNALLNANSPVFSGQAEAGSVVNLRDNNGAILCSVNADAGANWSCSINASLSDGPQTLSLTATDAAGNQSAPIDHSVTIDTVPPAPPIISTPADGAELTIEAPAFGGTAEAFGTVRVYNANQAILCSATARADGSWSCTPPPLLEGHNSLSASTTDPAGNEGAKMSLNITITTQRPAPPTFTNPVLGSAIAETRPLIQGEAAAGVTVTISDSAGGEICRIDVDSKGLWNCSFGADLADGQINLNAIATDHLGLRSTPTTHSFFVDTQAPFAPSIVTPANRSVIDGTKPTIGGNAESNTSLTISSESGTLLCATTVDANGNWSCALNVPLAVGENRLMVVITDGADNLSSATPHIIIVSDQGQEPTDQKIYLPLTVKNFTN